MVLVVLAINGIFSTRLAKAPTFGYILDMDKGILMTTIVRKGVFPIPKGLEEVGYGCLHP
jgi:hypothetical protein